MKLAEKFEGLPRRTLVLIPALCAMFNAIFLVTLRRGAGPHVSDFAQGLVTGVLLGVSFLCLLALWKKKQLSA